MIAALNSETNSKNTKAMRVSVTGGLYCKYCCRYLLQVPVVGNGYTYLTQ